jgi:23S rRNA (cytidine1920-2'-O)/16S rRNA (cytidine1409-2'-O)-methyltransferase
VTERTNIRNVTAAELPFRPDLIAIDASFISLKLVLAPVIALAASPAEIVMLIKPQFEVGKGNLGKGGVVRDDEARLKAVTDVVDHAKKLGLDVEGSIESPLRGPAGNREYLAVARIPASVS